MYEVAAVSEEPFDVLLADARLSLEDFRKVDVVLHERFRELVSLFRRIDECLIDCAEHC